MRPVGARGRRRGSRGAVGAVPSARVLGPGPVGPIERAPVRRGPGRAPAGWCGEAGSSARPGQRRWPPRARSGVSMANDGLVPARRQPASYGVPAGGGRRARPGRAGDGAARSGRGPGPRPLVAGHVRSGRGPQLRQAGRHGRMRRGLSGGGREPGGERTSGLVGHVLVGCGGRPRARRPVGWVSGIQGLALWFGGPGQQAGARCSGDGGLPGSVPRRWASRGGRCSADPGTGSRCSRETSG